MRTSTRCNRGVPRGRTRWAGGVTTMLTLFLLLVISQSVSAQKTTTCPDCPVTFPGVIRIDGDPCDWRSGNIAASHPLVFSYSQDPFGNNPDTSFTEGSKDFQLAADLTWTFGQTKAKNDIANAAVAIIGDTLYFAGDRTSNNGDAQIGFWFYLNGTAPAANTHFAPEHVVGDILVLADFTGGGNTAAVTVLKWVGSGGDVPNTNGTLAYLTTCNTGGVVVAENNDGPTKVPFEGNFDSPCYEQNEFYEGKIPLTCITGGGGNICFSRFLLETRSSQSITASLDDFVSGAFTVAPTAAAAGDLITCSHPTATLSGSGSSTGAGVTYLWTGPGTITNATSINATTQTGGVYTLKVTNGTGCTASATASVSVNTTAPGATASGGLVTCTTTSTTLTGGPSGFSYAWTGPGGFTSAVQSPTGVTAGGVYTLKVTNATNGCTSTATASVTVNNTPPTATATGNTITCGNTTTTITGTPATGVSYLWTGPGVVSGGATATATVNAGGVYTLKVTSTTNGCTATATASVSVAQCAVLCTYTQGYYGNVNGMSCSGVPDPAPNTFTTTQLINNSIANWGGTLTIGDGSRSVTVSTGQASCVIDVLPGGGGSAELPVGHFTICGLPASLLSKQGRINNALLAQTLTLGLNMGINPPSLTNYPLQANKWLVTAETVQCGSPDVKPCQFSCTPNLDGVTYTWTVTYSPYHVSSCKISTALYNALGAKTVGGLFALANAALNNTDGVVGSENGISLSEIQSVVDCINNAFDECRTVVGWFSGDTAPNANSFCTLPSSSTPCPSSITGTGGRTTDMTVAGNVTVQGLQVSAYPNPYKDAVKFTIQSKVSGQAELLIYNSLGQKVQTIYKGYIQANKSQVVDYKTPSPTQGNLIYVLNLGGKQVTGKLLQVD